MQIHTKDFNSKIIQGFRSKVYEITGDMAIKELKSIEKEIKNLVNEEKINFLENELRKYSEKKEIKYNPNTLYDFTEKDEIEKFVLETIQNIKANPEKYLVDSNYFHHEQKLQRHSNFNYLQYNHLIDLITELKQSESFWNNSEKSKKNLEKVINDCTSIVKNAEGRSIYFQGLYEKMEIWDETFEERLSNPVTSLETLLREIKGYHKKSSVDLSIYFRNCLSDLSGVVSDIENDTEAIEKELIKYTVAAYFNINETPHLLSPYIQSKLIELIKDRINTIEIESFVVDPTVKNLAIKNEYHKNILECYKILTDNHIIVDTNIKVFRGAFVDKQFIKKIMFRRNINNALLHEFITSISHCLMYRDQWERGCNCFQIEGKKPIKKDSLSSPGEKGKKSFDPTLPDIFEKAAKALKGSSKK